MNTQELISAPLRRNILNGNNYNSLIPRVSCDVISNFGNGRNDTIEGVEFMSEWVKKHSHQVKKLAKQLEKSTLQATVNSIYDFLYNHIQYNADGALQQLRSPACSWYHRQSGIDCKSFTIFASSLLRELNINHYIRQIKQPGFHPEQFTHVYVIVPTNQKSTPDVSHFSGNYLVVDPTEKSNTEPRFTQNLDKLMSGLKYVGMNAPSSATNTAQDTPLQLMAENAIVFKEAGFTYEVFVQLITYIEQLLAVGIRETQIDLQFLANGITITSPRGSMTFSPSNTVGWLDRFKRALQQNQGLNGLNNSDSSSDVDWIKVAFSSLGSLFGGSGGWYKNSMLEADGKFITEFFNTKVQQINQALQARNFPQLADHVASFKASANLMKKAADCMVDRCYRSGTWSSSTRNGLNNARNFINLYHGNAQRALDAWVNQFFIKGNLLSTRTYNGADFDRINSVLDMQHYDASFTEQVRVIALQPKPGLSIPAFKITEQVLELNNQKFNINQFLGSLTETIIGGSTPSTGTTVGSGFETAPGNTQTPTQAGIGRVDAKNIAYAGAGIAIILLMPKIVQIFKK